MKKYKVTYRLVVEAEDGIDAMDRFVEEVKQIDYKKIEVEEF